MKKTWRCVLVLLLFTSIGCSIPIIAPTVMPTISSTNSPPSTEPAPATAVPVVLTQPAFPTAQPQPTSTSLALLEQFDISITYFSDVISGLYHLYGESIDNLVEITITSYRDSSTQLRIENEIVGYSSPAVSTILIGPGESHTVVHNPVFLPDSIDSLFNEKEATLTTRITLVGETLETELYFGTNDVLLFSRRDFPNWLSPERPFWAVAKYLAAWVTPNDRAIEGLLRNAANWHELGVITSGYAYPDNDYDRDVQDRLEAIWNSIAYDYQVTYVSTTVSFAPGAQQRIRLPGEVLEQRSGNCIELVLLMASALEAIELQPSIVLIPGHAFLGVKAGWDSSNNYFVETTMIGQGSLVDAINAGNQEWEATKNHTAAEGYHHISIPEARQIGILPMPWR